MQHLFHATQHSVTREEMTAQFSQFEGRNQERFKLIGKRFDDLQREIKEKSIKEASIYIRYSLSIIFLI